LLEGAGNGNLNMEKLVLFIVASAFEFGLGVFLFRDQIFSQAKASKPRATTEKDANLLAAPRSCSVTEL
jgi:hypothetical protein